MVGSYDGLLLAFIMHLNKTQSYSKEMSGPWDLSITGLAQGVKGLGFVHSRVNR